VAGIEFDADAQQGRHPGGRRVAAAFFSMITPCNKTGTNS